MNQIENVTLPERTGAGRSCPVGNPKCDTYGNLIADGQYAGKCQCLRDRNAKALWRDFSHQVGRMSGDDVLDALNRFNGCLTAILEAGRNAISAGRGLIVAGGVGIGKTMGCLVLARWVLRDLNRETDIAKGGMFTSGREFSEITTDFRKGETELSLGEEYLREMKEIGFLFFDDFTHLRGSEWVHHHFERVISERHANRRLTIMTTNLSKAHIGESLPVASVSRIFDPGWMEVFVLGSKYKDLRREKP